MFSHVVVGTNNLERAKRFYDAVLGTLGYGEGINDDNEKRRRYVYRTETALFIITQPLDGRPATHANGGTIGFTCKTAVEVDLWHAAGVANGGRSVENPPGLCDTKDARLYLAYLRDPDDNKLSALYREPC
jgi:catechol 2,3-dioxygenase-like lactoylglutathione lyase family enzyme